MAYDPAQTSRADVRKRPGMYIGSTGKMGIAVMALEVLENSIDLVLGGRADAINVACHEDRSIEIRDNGPGLNLADERVRSFFEIGHDNATADGHRPHIHLWEVGLGLFVINALCERLVATSVHLGTSNCYEWTNGGEHSRSIETAPATSNQESFTSIRFWPDRAIFGDSTVRPDELAYRLTELERLIPELRSVTFSHQSIAELDGLTAMMRDRHRLTSDEIWRHSTSIRVAGNEPIEIDLAMAATHPGRIREHRFDEQMLIFCNFRQVTEESGIQRAIRSALGTSDADPLRGLALVCNLRMLSPQFSGPTRGRVDDPNAMEAVGCAVAELLDTQPTARSAINDLTAS